MRSNPQPWIERYRIKSGHFKSEPGELYGMFLVQKALTVLSSGVLDTDFGWEHVSVSHRKRCPTWEEMCKIKKAFWGEEEVVMQLHPPESQYVNNHPFCLHMWRPMKGEIPLPPAHLVGFLEKEASSD